MHSCTRASNARPRTLTELNPSGFTPSLACNLVCHMTYPSGPPPHQDTSAASASLKLAALQFLTAALTEARGVNAAALLPALPSVLQATLDRYYKVAAAALRAVAAAAPALAGAAPAGAGDDKHDPASPPAPALADAATAVLARLRPVDLDQEVKEGAIAAAAALLAALGDALGLETQAVGELTREFAAMPKARTSKRAKLSGGGAEVGAAGGGAAGPSAEVREVGFLGGGWAVQAPQEVSHGHTLVYTPNAPLQPERTDAGAAAGEGARRVHGHRCHQGL